MKTKKECRWKAQEYGLKIIDESKRFILSENSSQTKVVCFYKTPYSRDWEEHRIRWDDVDEYLCQKYDVTLKDLKGPSRKRKVSKARMIGMYIRINMLNQPNWKVSRMYGRYDDHSYRSNKWVYNQMKEDIGFEDELKSIITDLNLS